MWKYKHELMKVTVVGRFCFSSHCLRYVSDLRNTKTLTNSANVPKRSVIFFSLLLCIFGKVLFDLFNFILRLWKEISLIKPVERNPKNNVFQHLKMLIIIIDWEIQNIIIRSVNKKFWLDKDSKVYHIL